MTAQTALTERRYRRLAQQPLFSLTEAVSDRLEDLKRQRALAAEQQARLDREIAREMGAAPQPAATPVGPAQSAGSAGDADADKIIEQYRSAKPIRSQVKQGCMVYFFAAFALVGLGLLALYLSHRLK